MTLLPALTFGFMLGVKHATDADHVAAIGTLASGDRSALQAARLGALWGIGHSVSVLLVGGALVLLRLPMPARLALGLEFVVALMLVALGLRSLRQRAPGQPSLLRPFLVGIVHGLAGSAVLALLLIGTATTTLAAAVYLLCFGLGTVGGMAVITALLSLPGRLNPARALRFERGLRMTAGVASVVIGLWLAHKLVITDGLFAAAPRWEP
jgi:high-affinity nickel-transport protein